MKISKIKEILQNVENGQLSIDDALASLRDLPFKDMGYASVDHHRNLRQGFPEVVLGNCFSIAPVPHPTSRIRLFFAMLI